MLKKINFFLFIFIVFLQISCKETDYSPIEYSVAVGQSSVFKVTDESYTISGQPVISNYYIQENIVDKKTENGEDTYTVQQFTKTKSTDSWSAKAVFTIKQTPTEIIRFENSVPLKILNKPISENSKWNLNEYNNQKETTLMYTKVGDSYSNFSSTFTVFQDSDSSLIATNKHYSIYSPSAGLLYKENTNLNFCQSTPECIGKGIISYGKREIWTKVN